MLGAVQVIFGVGLFYAVMWFFFPHALLVPVVAVLAGLCLAVLILPFRVVLDPGLGELAITVASWTRRVPLTRVARVDERRRLGAEIAIAGGWSIGIGPFARRRWLAACCRWRSPCSSSRRPGAGWCMPGRWRCGSSTERPGARSC